MDAIVTTRGRAYALRFDRTCLRRVFARGAVLDDAGGRPVPPPFRVRVAEPLLVASAHDFGYALSGDPDVALRDRSVPHVLDVTIEAPGYHPATVTVSVPADPTLPVAGPTALLRRRPVALRGRVLARATGTPIPGAALSLVGPALPPPAQAALLSSPLVRSLSPGAVVRGRNLVAVISPVPVKTAEGAAPAGGLEVILDDRRGLAAGQLLRFGPPERAHYAEIAAVPPTPPDPAQPGPVSLTAPLARTVRLGDPAAPFAQGPGAGPVCNLVGAAMAGEGILILDAQPAGDVLRIVDPPSPPAFHGRGIVAGPDGGYLIAGIARLAAPVLRAAAAGFAPESRAWPVPWQEPVSTLDWRLAP